MSVVIVLDIFVQFVFEASVLAAMGSIIGLWLGWSTSQVAAARAGVPFVFESSSAGLALGSAMLLNLMFANWPALKAARLDPSRAIA